MKMRMALLAVMAAAMLTAMSARAQQAAAPAPAGGQQIVSPANAPLPELPKQTTRTGKHVNRVIDMWLKGQPVYYSSTDDGGYENGKKMAGTKADYINYGMEHGPLDFKGLHDFMQGLVDAGPTRSGHRTPRQRLDGPAGAGAGDPRHPSLQRRESRSGPHHDRVGALSIRAAG